MNMGEREPTEKIPAPIWEDGSQNSKTTNFPTAFKANWSNFKRRLFQKFKML